MAYMRKVLILLSLVLLGLGSAVAETPRAVRVRGTIYATTPCALANQCDQYAPSTVCIQQTAPLAGLIELSNSKSKVAVELLGSFKAKLLPGRYSVSFKRFDGVAENCIPHGNTISCTAVNTSDVFSKNIEVKSRARVTKNKRFVYLQAQAAPCE